MIIESYKVFEEVKVVTYGYCKHVIKTLGFISINYSLKQKLLNLLGLSDYSPVYIDRKIKQTIDYDTSCGGIIPSEHEKINREKYIQKRHCEESLWCCNFKEWPEIETKIKRYIINAGGSLKKSYIHGYEKRGS